MPKADPVRNVAPSTSDRESGRAEIPGQVVVKLTQAARKEPRSLERLLEGFRAPAKITANVDRFGIALLQVAPTDADDLIERLRQSDRVEHAEPNLFESGS